MKNDGFSLVETMIAAGILGGVALFAAHQSKLSGDIKAKTEQNTDLNLMINNIHQYLMNDENCSLILQGHQFRRVRPDTNIELYFGLKKKLDDSGNYSYIKHPDMLTADKKDTKQLYETGKDYGRIRITEFAASADPSGSNALKVTFAPFSRKKETSLQRYVKYFPIQATYDSSGRVRECYSVKAALNLDAAQRSCENLFVKNTDSGEEIKGTYDPTTETCSIQEALDFVKKKTKELICNDTGNTYVAEDDECKQTAGPECFYIEDQSQNLTNDSSTSPSSSSPDPKEICGGGYAIKDRIVEGKMVQTGWHYWHRCAGGGKNESWSDTRVSCKFSTGESDCTVPDVGGGTCGDGGVLGKSGHSVWRKSEIDPNDVDSSGMKSSGEAYYKLRTFEPVTTVTYKCCRPPAP